MIKVLFTMLLFHVFSDCLCIDDLYCEALRIDLQCCEYIIAMYYDYFAWRVTYLAMWCIIIDRIYMYLGICYAVPCCFIY